MSSRGSLLSEARDNDALPTFTPAIPQLTPAESQEAARLSEQFAAQGMRLAPGTNLLWCALCTTMAVRDQATASTPTIPATDGAGEGPERHETVLGASTARASVPAPPNSAAGDEALLSTLVLLAGQRDAVMMHCATRAHLLAYEALQERGLSQWCHAEINGRRVLLDHHCIYPGAMYGPGRALMNRTMAGGMLIASDACGGVKLWPRHKYEVVELVLPSAHNTATCTLEKDERLVDKGVDGDDGVGEAHAQTRLMHTLSGRPQHLREADVEGRSQCGWARWRTGPRQRVPKAVLVAAQASADDVNATLPCHARTAVLPAFSRQPHGLRGDVRRHRGSAAHVLHQVNASIKGEASARIRRRRRLEAHNLKAEAEPKEDEARA